MLDKFDYIKNSKTMEFILIDIYINIDYYIFWYSKINPLLKKFFIYQFSIVFIYMDSIYIDPHSYYIKIIYIF